MLLLPANLTVDEAVDTQRLLTQALRLETDPGVIVDASNLKRFDSAALAVLLECKRQASGRTKPFNVRGAPAKLIALARLYGVDGVLRLASESTGDGATMRPTPPRGTLSP